MEKRRGASISVKMIATSTLLILGVVALFGILNIVNTIEGLRGAGAAPARFVRHAAAEARHGRRRATWCSRVRTPLCRTTTRRSADFVPVDRQGRSRDRLRPTLPTRTASCSRTPTTAMRGKPLTDPVAKEMLATPRKRSPRKCRRRLASEYVFCPPGRAGRRPPRHRRPRLLAARCSTTTLKKMDSEKEAAVPGGVGAHRARRALLRAHRHGARDLPGPAHLAADQDAGVARRSDRARRSRDPRRDHARATRSACSARTSTSWPTRSLILMRETAEKATLEKELEVARTIQETLVPPPRSRRARLRPPRRLLPAGVAVRRRLVDGARHARRARSWS